MEWWQEKQERVDLDQLQQLKMSLMALMPIISLPSSQVLVFFFIIILFHLLSSKLWRKGKTLLPCKKYLTFWCRGRLFCQKGIEKQTQHHQILVKFTWNWVNVEMKCFNGGKKSQTLKIKPKKGYFFPEL